MRNDNWAHRSIGMRCRSCMFWVSKAQSNPDQQFSDPTYPTTEPDPGQAPPRELGRCRRHAPTLAGWPTVFADDWCGDHKLDENKT